MVRIVALLTYVPDVVHQESANHRYPLTATPALSHAALDSRLLLFMSYDYGMQLAYITYPTYRCGGIWWPTMMEKHV